jgi:hypothetical protein
MPHVFEPAASGRSKCRGCGRNLEKGEIRFGEHLPNPFADGTEMTLWFHPLCAAYKRPEAMIEALGQATTGVPDRERLEATARASLAHQRVQRVDGIERGRGQANCRQCREPIPRGEWRIRLVFFEEGRFNPSGFIHLGCARDYFEGADIAERAFHFSPDLSAEDRDALRSALGAA